MEGHREFEDAELDGKQSVIECTPELYIFYGVRYLDNHSGTALTFSSR